jgi:hypothetical protein
MLHQKVKVRKQLTPEKSMEISFGVQPVRLPLLLPGKNFHSRAVSAGYELRTPICSLLGCAVKFNYPWATSFPNPQ